MAKKSSIFDHPSFQEEIQKIRHYKKPTEDEYRQAIKAFLLEMNRDLALDGPPMRFLKEILGRKNLKELKHYARYHSLKNLGGIGKDALAIRLTEAICDAWRLEDEIKCMAEEEWIFFTAALINGTVDLEAVPGRMIHHLLDGGYIHIFYDEGKIIYILPDEVRASYDTLDKERLLAFKKMQCILDEYAHAAVNLYGVISLKEFAGLTHHYAFEGKKAILDERLYDIFLEGYDGRDDDYVAWEGYLVSKELVHENGEVSAKGVHSLLDDRNGKPRYQPCAEVFLKYADQNYYESTPQVSALHQALLSFDVEEKKADRVIKTLHDVIAGEFELNEMFHVLERHGVVLEFEQLKTTLRLVTDMSNHTRIWSNYGHTPDEMLLRRGSGAPRNHLMDDTDGNGFPNEAERLSLGAGKPVAVAPLAPQGNIPRNGPCLCGSGKKYKHCCGREK